MHRRVLALLPLALVSLPTAIGRAQDRVVSITDAAAAVPGARVERAVPAASAPAPALAPPYGQLAGFPKLIGGNATFAPQRGLVFADLDGDGPLEVIVSSTDKMLYAWDHTGASMPGFPVLLNNYAQSAPSVADLDRDGDLEIVQFTRGPTSGGRVYVIDHLGNVLPGFPLSINNHNFEGAPVLFDLDDDGVLEILVPERAYPIGYLNVVEMNGTTWGGSWPLTLDHVPTCSTAIGDLDGDGVQELVYLSYTSLFVWDANGNLEPGWPKQIANANFSYQSPALVDLDHDGDLEIVVGAHQNAAGVYVFHHDGTSYPGWPNLTGTWTYCPPTVVDLEGDGKYEIFSGREGLATLPSEVFYGWRAGGAPLSGFPYTLQTGGGSAGSISAADLDGDGVLEVFTDHNKIDASGLGFVFGVDRLGNDLPGFPLRPVGFTYMNGAQIADVDGDGDVELGVLSFHDAVVEVNVFEIGGSTWLPSDAPWPTYHARNERGGLDGSGDRLHVQGDVSPGAAFTLHEVGEPGGAAFLWLGFATGGVDTPYGWFHLAGGAPVVAFAGVPMPAAGEISIPVNVPAVPGLSGLSFHLQGLTYGPTEPPRFTNLVSKTIP